MAWIPAPAIPRRSSAVDQQAIFKNHAAAFISWKLVGLGGGEFVLDDLAEILFDREAADGGDSGQPCGDLGC